jgi:hypothetical protein
MALTGIAGLFLTSCCCPPQQPIYTLTSHNFYIEPGKPPQSGANSDFSGGNGTKPPRPGSSGPGSGGGGAAGSADRTGGGGGSGARIIQAQNPLPVMGIKQEGYYSCWSTCAEMIMQFHGRVVHQCTQANAVFTGPFDCCNPAGNPNGVLSLSPDCDNPSSPQFTRWGFYGTRQRPPLGSSTPAFGAPLLFSEIRDEIDAGRPVCFAWIENHPGTTPLPGQPGHMLVIVGYDDPSMMLKVLDPRWQSNPDQYWIPYLDYNGGSGAYTHEEVYFTIRP